MPLHLQTQASVEWQLTLREWQLTHEGVKVHLVLFQHSESLGPFPLPPHTY